MTLTTTDADWTAVAESWEKEPCTTPSVAPVSLPRVHDAIVAACAPFRSGTQVRALPDVRFSVVGGRLRAPGGLLPDPNDGELQRYLNRLDERLSGEGYLLAVDAPQLMDFAFWSGVRDAIRGLWRHLGPPVLPVSATVFVGDRFTRHDGLIEPTTHATLTWVLHGTMRTWLWDEGQGPAPATLVDASEPPSGAIESVVTAGEVAYRPSSYRYADRYEGRCVALRLAIPTDPGLVTVAAKDLLVDVLRKAREQDDVVPYLSFPPPAVDGVIDAVAPLAATGAALRSALDAPALMRTLRIIWAARRSADGFEPVPPARDGSGLVRDDRVRACAEIIRTTDGPDRSIWAVNGHVFHVGGTAGERILAELRPDRCIGVDELCRAAGAGADDEGVLALLRRLYGLRAIQRTGEEHRP